MKKFLIGILVAFVLGISVAEVEAGGWGRRVHRARCYPSQPAFYLPRVNVGWSYLSPNCGPRPYCAPQSYGVSYYGYYPQPRVRYVPVVYVPPPPVVVQQVPVVVRQPVVVAAVQVEWIKFSNGQTIEKPPPDFIQTGYRLHGSGSNAGLVDELYGTRNGKQVEIEYADNGAIEEID